VVAPRGFTFEHVSVTAGTTTILDDIDLTLPTTGLTAVAGPSGSGKSTLLRLCNRLEVPTAGRVLLDGVDLADIDPLALRRRCGMVFQRPAVFGGTVADNLSVADPAGHARHDEALARVGLAPHLLGRQADDLSGGEAQRLCIARTLLTGPQVLLCDEASSALDVDARERIERLVLDLVAGGLGTLWVTHDLDQAERLTAAVGGRTIVVLAGRVVPPAEAAAYVRSRSFERPGGAL
jgi:putative ABC transport system ATP-binding protein